MSSQRNRVVTIIYSKRYGQMPGFLALAQRHFEKAPPEPNKLHSYVVPLDFLRMTMPDSYVDDIAEVDVLYAER